jgi:AraC-like DNA-binding protein
MISIIVLSCIIVQTAITIYLFNTLKLKDNFEKNLNAMLIILFFHLGIKFFFLAIMKSSFLYANNSTGFGLSYGPLLYITARTYKKNPLSRRNIFLHMLPFLIFTLVYFMNSAAYMMGYDWHLAVKEYASVYQWIVAISLLVYPIITYRILKGERQVATATNSRLRLLRSILYIMITGITAGVVTTIVHSIQTGTWDFDLRLLPYICFSILPVLILKYKMNTAPAAIHDKADGISQEPLLSTDPLPEQHYKKSAVDERMMDEYELLLKTFMQKSRIFLEPEISLEDLAAKTNIPRHHLTQLLNERFKKNFYTFINEYRIEEAINRLRDPGSDTSILSLAYDCGFNSKSSFNNYFKKITGLTPSMYRKENALNEVE